MPANVSLSLFRFLSLSFSFCNPFELINSLDNWPVTVCVRNSKLHPHKQPAFAPLLSCQFHWVACCLISPGPVIHFRLFDSLACTRFAWISALACPSLLEEENFYSPFSPLLQLAFPSSHTGLAYCFLSTSLFAALAFPLPLFGPLRLISRPFRPSRSFSHSFSLSHFIVTVSNRPLCSSLHPSVSPSLFVALRVKWPLRQSRC